jgi:hypothetical protein
MGSWQPCFFKAGDQPSTDIAMRQHRVKNGAEAVLQLYVEVDARQRTPGNMACRPMECDNAALAYSPCCSSYRGDGIGLMMQDIAPDRSIERRMHRESVIRRDDKFNPSKSGRECSRSGDVDRTRFSVVPADSPDGSVCCARAAMAFATTGSPAEADEATVLPVMSSITARPLVPAA